MQCGCSGQEVAPAWRVCWTAPWAVLSPDCLCVHSSATDTLGRWGFRGEVPGGGFGQCTCSPPPEKMGSEHLPPMAAVRSEEQLGDPESAIRSDADPRCPMRSGHLAGTRHVANS